MKCIRLGILFLGGLFLLFPLRPALGDEADSIDPTIRSQEVDGLSDSEKDAVVRSEVDRVSRPENLVAQLHGELDELDREGTRPACWGGGWGSGWGWSGWGGYSLSYSSYWSNPWSCPGSLYYGGYSYGYGYGYGGYGGYYPYYSYYPSYGWYW
jgi:hypothetical protein